MMKFWSWWKAKKTAVGFIMQRQNQQTEEVKQDHVLNGGLDGNSDLLTSPLLSILWVSSALDDVFPSFLYVCI